MLIPSFSDNVLEAGCDEAGRGCLAGPVYAATVIFPKGYSNPELDDSKKLSTTRRENLRKIIEKDALDWAVAAVDNREIDKINILQASFVAMHRAIDKLKTLPGLILVDGNRFKPYRNIPFRCVISGDALFQSIAAASILAKTYRDDYMKQIHEEFPLYNWNSNKGYPTLAHRKAIGKVGISPYHRLTFTTQLSIWESMI